MIEIVNSDEYIRRMLEAYRPGAENIHAFYEHRIGVIGKDPKLMLIPLDDHIVHRGDGVFETLKYVNGRIYQLDAHLERMERSSKGIHIDPPCSWGKIREITMEVARASGKDTGILSLFLARGCGGFTTDFRECPVSGFYVVARHFHPKEDDYFEKGVTGFRTTIPAKQEYIARIKAVNYLPNVLMKREAIEKGYDFPVCFDNQGFMAEGATENILMVDKSGRIIVPESNNSLVGTTLMRGLDLIKSEVGITFRPVTEEEMYEAKELVVIGTTLDAVAMVRFNGKPIHDVRPGPIARRLRELLVDDLLRNGVQI